MPVGCHMRRGTSVSVPERSSRGGEPGRAIRSGIKGKDTLSIPHGSANSVWSDVLRPIGSKGRRRGLKGILGREGMEGHGVRMVGGHGWGLEGRRCGVAAQQRGVGVMTWRAMSWQSDGANGRKLRPGARNVGE